VLVFRKDDKVDFDEYEQNIRQKGYVLIDYNRFCKIEMYCRIRSHTLEMMAYNTMAVESGGHYPDMDKKSVINFLKRNHGITSDELINRKSKTKDSLDQKNVLEPLLNKGKAVQFLEQYMGYKSYAAVANRGPGFKGFMDNQGDIGNNGQPLYRVPVYPSRQENNRYNYRDPDIVSLGEEFKPSFAARRGYCLVSADLAQSDFRILLNTLLLSADLREFFVQYPDRYEGLFRKICELYEVEFVEEEFREMRELYKVNALESMYGSKGKGGKSAQVVARMSRFYKSCERYLEHTKRIKRAVKLGKPIPVEDYFGFVQDIPIISGDTSHTENKCLNTPIQTGTSHIIILAVNRILKMFRDLGYSKDDVSIYKVRHDEAVFEVKIEALKDAWIFKSAETLQVDDWTPLNLEFSYQYNYTEPDPGLTAMAYKSYEEHGEYIDDREIEHTGLTFFPIKDTFECGIGIEGLGDKTLVVVYCEKLHQAKTLVLNTTDPQVILGAVHSVFVENGDNFKDYLGLIVYNPFKETKPMYDQGHDNYFLYTSKDDDKICDKAYVIAHSVASKIAKDKGVDFEVNDFMLDSNKTLLKGVEPLSVLSA
jgi:hypothetical protein